MHLYCALQGVEPNSDSFSVRSLRQRGHATTRVANKASLMALVSGGDMPLLRSFSRPSGVIHDVVHAGVSMRSTRALNPALVNAVKTSCSITCTAGQPM